MLIYAHLQRLLRIVKVNVYIFVLFLISPSTAKNLTLLEYHLIHLKLATNISTKIRSKTRPFECFRSDISLRNDLFELLTML